MANNIGRILFGVGGIFYALNLISAGMSPLKELPEFSQYMITLGKKSNSGCSSGSHHHRFDSSFVSYHWDSTRFVFRWFPRSSWFFTYSFGDNIGTTLQLLLLRWGPIFLKRVAATHVLFNLIGTIPLFDLVNTFTAMIEYFKGSCTCHQK